uniref:Uncharacterized protein n=1 Tax=Agrobacterium fabrum TaxID=1176649 RepID=A0A2Z2PRD9_9HYPH|nr:hypothetical protein [Agrobacterium fabrum]
MPQWPWRKKRSNVDEYGRSSLWHHAAEGNLVSLENELRGSTDNVSAADKDGFTALHVAAQNGHPHIVRKLLAAGAEVNVIDRYGNGPLWTASRQASLSIATEAGIRDCSAAAEKWGQSASCQQRQKIACGMGYHKCQNARNIYRSGRASPDRSRVGVLSRNS